MRMTLFETNHWSNDHYLAEKLVEHYSAPEYAGLETDWRIIAAIEAITGADILDEESEAHAEWRDGYRIDEIRRWLDEHLPKWREDAPLCWGCDSLDAEERA